MEAINSVFENLQKRVDEISNKVLRDTECVNQIFDQENQIVPPYQNSGNVCVNQNLQNVLPYQKCESVSFNTNVSHCANQQRKPPKHYRTPCFRCGKCDHFPSQCRCITRMCRLCKKIGHIAIMCPSKFKRLKPRQKQKVVGSASSYEHQNKVKARVAGHVVSALVDTGADISIISEKLYKKAKLHRNYPLQNSVTFARGVTGTHLKINGQTTITVEIGNFELHQLFHVTDQCSQDLILVLDFLKTQNAKIDFSEGNLILQKGTCISVVPFQRKDESFVCNISLISSVKIPPRSEIILPVQSNHKDSIKSKFGVIEMNSALTGTHSVVGATCLIQKKDNKSVARIMNPTNSEIDL